MAISPIKHADTTCPLCGARATVDEVDAPRWRRYSCTACKEFTIAARAEEKLRGGASGDGERLGACARAAPEGRRCVVRVERRRGREQRIYCRYESDR